MLRMTFPLSNGNEVSIRLTTQMTESDYERMLSFLELARPDLIEEKRPQNGDVLGHHQKQIFGAYPGQPARY